MKWVYLINNVVREVIPDYATPPEKWYGAEFAAQCVEAPDEVEQGWVYDSETGKFAPPTEPEPLTPEPTDEERNRADIDYIALMLGVELL